MLPTQPEPTALQLDPALFRQLVENLDQVFWIAPGDRSRFFYVSPASEAVWGYSCQTLYERPDAWLDAVVPEDRPAVAASLRRRDTHPEETPPDLIARVRTTGDSVRWLRCRSRAILDGQGRARLWVGTVEDITDLKQTEAALLQTRDELEERVAERTAALEEANARLLREVTERRQAEQAARDSEARYRGLLGAVPDALFVISKDGVFLEYKPAKGFETFRSPAEFLGKHVRDILPPEPALAALRHIRQALQASTLVVYEYELPFPEGVRRFEGRVFPIHADAVLAVVRDISERTRAEQQMRRLQEELAHTARLTTMGVLASGLAHEVNQPLTAIVAYARACVRFLQQGRADPADLLKALDQIAVQAERAGEVIRRLRTFVSRKESQRSTVFVNELVREVLQLDEYELRSAGVRVTLDLADALPPVRVDSVQIQQVVLNLLRNAVDAMQTTPPERRELVLRSEREGPAAVRVSVRDCGTGLPPEIAQHLFEPFRTTKPEGMGMGLAISRSLVEAHGGLMSAEPHPEGGTTFFFTLPACQGGD